MSDLSIKVASVRYQRNGICGIGFYAVAFTFTEDGETRAMVGFVVPPDDKKPGAQPEVYGVMDPADMREMWRGDRFVDDLWAACQTASADGSAHKWAHEVAAPASAPAEVSHV